jgi:hypothetical protein
VETTTAPTARRVQVGDTVRIVCGAHRDRVGKVTHTGITALYVEFEAPVLITEPDGPRKTYTLPFSSRELVRVQPNGAAA